MCNYTCTYSKLSASQFLEHGAHATSSSNVHMYISSGIDFSGNLLTAPSRSTSYSSNSSVMRGVVSVILGDTGRVERERERGKRGAVRTRAKRKLMLVGWLATETHTHILNIYEHTLCGIYNTHTNSNTNSVPNLHTICSNSKPTQHNKTYT